MSLINDALKKTQRDRAVGETSVEPPMPGGAPRARIAKRAAPMPAQKLVLIIAGIVVLIVLSAVGTALLLNR